MTGSLLADPGAGAGEGRFRTARILILHNAPAAGGGFSDREAEEEILATVRALEEALGATHPVGTLEVARSAGPLVRRLERRDFDVVFNLCESVGGVAALEPLVPVLLDLLDIPYTGSGPAALHLCLDKARTKLLLAGAGLPTPDFRVVEDPARLPSGLPPFPLFVKPSAEDASIGIGRSSLCGDRREVARAVRSVVRATQGPALVERYVDGREVNAAVVGDGEVLPLSEIVFTRARGGAPFVSYEGKWKPGHPDFTDSVPRCPADLPGEVAARIGGLAREAFRLTGCRDYARVDFRLDGDLRPFILEVNPNPDLSPDAGLARQVLASGRTYEGFLKELLRRAWSRRSEGAAAPGKERPRVLAAR